MRIDELAQPGCLQTTLFAMRPLFTSAGACIADRSDLHAASPRH